MAAAAVFSAAAALGAIVYYVHPFAPIGYGDRNDDPVFKDCETCPDMVWIPAGVFDYGVQRRRDLILVRLGLDAPLRTVEIPRAFAVSRTEITFDQWQACVDEGGCGGNSPDDEGWGRGDRPVINVTWNDAKAYVSWLSHKTGQSYRLLTEVEWEYVALAGGQTHYAWGPRPDPDLANYGGENCPPCEGRAHGQDRWRYTAPVAQFPPNRYGVFDMHGNVYEWVEDCLDQNEDAARCPQRVLRGGGWHNDGRRVSAIYRAHNPPHHKDNKIGVRVARDLGRQPPLIDRNAQRPMT